MIEIQNKRSYNRKVFLKDNGETLYRFRVRHCHYKDTNGNLQDIDTRLSFDSIQRKWLHSKASYKPAIPEYADEWFEFANNYEGANHTIKARPIANHVQGTYAEEFDGSVAITYPEAFGKGIDLKVYSYWAGLKKVVIINEKPAVLSDMSFDFELELPAYAEFKVKSSEDDLLDITKTIDFTDKTIKLGEVGKESYFRNALMWDSAGLTESVSIKIITIDGKLYIRKTIPQAFLEKAVFPVYTDHPTSYYVGTAAGDGDVWKSSEISWSDCHNATSGTVNATATTARCLSSYFTGTYTVRRTFVPIDTSGIDDGATITAAILKLYVTTKSDGGNDANDWYNVVQTSQASTSSLATTDYDNCGNVSNPTEGGTRVDIDNITTSAYNDWTLDATGIGWIDKTGITKLGLREGHDALNSAPDDFEYVDITWATTEDTSGTKDPYLDVTTAAGGDATATPSLVSILVSLFTAISSISISSIGTLSLANINIVAFSAIATSSINATATPSMATAEIIAYQPIQSVASSRTALPDISLTNIEALTAIASSSSSASATATPSLATTQVLSFQPSALFSTSKTASPSLSEVSIQAATPTQTLNASSTAQPSTSSVTVQAYAATALFSGAGIVTALPSLASISITSPTPQQSFSASRTAAPSVSIVTITAYTPTATAGAFVTASPAASFLSILLNSPTVSFYSNRIAEPFLSLISINPYDATATFGIAGSVTIPYRIESLMEKQINKESRMNKYINIESTLVN